MTIINFSPMAYAYLYHSLVKLQRIRKSDAACLIYMLYTANIDCFNAHSPHGTKELDPVSFVFAIRKRGRPYKTHIQLYKAIQALLKSIEWDCLTFTQKKAVRYLKGIELEIDWHFYRVYGMDIESRETAYKRCRFHLIPGKKEPSSPFADNPSTEIKKHTMI